MNYELAKQLKEAGFPQREDVHPDYKDSSLQWQGNRRDGYVYIPTLEELIEACGESGNTFSALQHIESRWRATGYNNAKDIWEDCNYSTPTEAVARLWLALNKK